jgi:hypothetical protein
MSSSWRSRSLAPHPLHAVGSCRATVIALQPSQYHAGIRCPHHSWREMHQSRMLVIQCMNVFVHRSGTNFVLPSVAAAAAFSASGAVFTNHCSMSIGSTTAPDRCERPRGTL